MKATARVDISFEDLRNCGLDIESATRGAVEEAIRDAVRREVEASAAIRAAIREEMVQQFRALIAPELVRSIKGD